MADKDNKKSHIEQLIPHCSSAELNKMLKDSQDKSDSHLPFISEDEDILVISEPRDNYLKYLRKKTSIALSQQKSAYDPEVIRKRLKNANFDFVPSEKLENDIKQAHDFFLRHIKNLKKAEDKNTKHSSS